MQNLFHCTIHSYMIFLEIALQLEVACSLLFVVVCLCAVLKVSHANPDLENGTELEVKHVRRYSNIQSTTQPDNILDCALRSLPPCSLYLNCFSTYRLESRVSGVRIPPRAAHFSFLWKKELS